MTGLIFFGVVIAYVALFWVIAARAKSLWARVATIAVALLIPFWEFPIGYGYFLQACSTESGVHIDKRLPPIDALLIGDSTAYRPEDAAKLGLKIVEYKYRDDFIRYTADHSGLTKSTVRKPISRFSLEYSGNQPMPWNVLKNEHLVTRLSDGAILARQTDFSWRGMWWEVAGRVHVTGFNHCKGAEDQSLLKSLRFVN